MKLNKIEKIYINNQKHANYKLFKKIMNLRKKIKKINQ